MLNRRSIFMGFFITTTSLLAKKASAAASVFKLPSLIPNTDKPDRYEISVEDVKTKAIFLVKVEEHRGTVDISIQMVPPETGQTLCRLDIAKYKKVLIKNEKDLVSFIGQVVGASFDPEETPETGVPNNGM